MSVEPSPALVREYPRPRLEELFDRAVRLGLDFASGSARGDLVLRYAPAAELARRFADSLPTSGVSDDELLALLADVASWSVAQADPRYLAFPDTGDSVAGIAGGIVAAFLNQNLIAFDRSAPVGSVIEAQLIGWLRELVGFPTTPLTQYAGPASLGGMWTSGGNMSNHVAVLVALAHAFPQVRDSGLVGLPERPAILLASGVEHFSYLGAAQTLGLGSKGLLFADPADDYTTDPAGIAYRLANPPAGVRIVMVVGVAGNCRTTGLDDLDALATVCERYGVWFHVDACHGSSLLFSDRLRHLVGGVHRADSVSLDPHKGLFVTYPSSYVLFRDPATLGGFARYPDKAADPQCFDLGLVTPFYGSRGFESLKLWAFIRHQGRAGIARLVESRQRAFQQLQSVLERSGLFRILGTSSFYRCAFVFCPPAVDAVVRSLSRDPALHDRIASVVSAYTTAFCEQLYESGEVVFDLFALADLGDRLGLGAGRRYQVMGMCVGHPEIDGGTETAVEKSIHAVGERLTEGMLAALHSLETVAPDRAARAGGPAGW